MTKKNWLMLACFFEWSWLKLHLISREVVVTFYNNNINSAKRLKLTFKAYMQKVQKNTDHDYFYSTNRTCYIMHVIQQTNLTQKSLYTSSTAPHDVHAAFRLHILMFTLESDGRRECNWLSYHGSDWQNKSDSEHVSPPQSLMKVMNGHEQITLPHSLSWLSSHTHRLTLSASSSFISTSTWSV